MARAKKPKLDPLDGLIVTVSLGNEGSARAYAIIDGPVILARDADGFAREVAALVKRYAARAATQRQSSLLPDARRYTATMLAEAASERIR